MDLPTYKSVISGMSSQLAIAVLTSPRMSLSDSFFYRLSPLQAGKMKRFDLFARVKILIAAFTKDGFYRI